MEAINTKLASLSINMLKDMAIKLNDDFQDGADIVLNAIMTRLESMMPEVEYVAFCDAL